MLFLRFFGQTSGTGPKKRTANGAEREERTERANPESHGNLATSAIGRTCTRSNLKSRSRTNPTILSFVRVIRIHVRRFVGHLCTYTGIEWYKGVKGRQSGWLCFYLPFTVSLAASQWTGTPGTSAEVLSLCLGTGVPLFLSPTFAYVNKRSTILADGDALNLPVTRELYASPRPRLNEN